MLRLTLLALPFLVVACAPRDRHAPPGGDDVEVDAGAALPARASLSDETARALVSTLAKKPLFAGQLASTAKSDVALPALANAPVHVATRDAWVDVVALGTGESVARDVGHARVHGDVAPATDLVRVALPGGFEEIRWLRDASAPSAFREELRTGPGIDTVRLREGRVELVDAHGYVQLASAPMFAVDARGVHRALEVAVEGRTVVAHLDTEGLAYPIAIDPSWTTIAPVATPRTSATLVALGGRQALLAGGTAVASSTVVATTELYDAATNTWSTVGSLNHARNGGAAALLTTSGHVLLCGGTDATFALLSSCERYTPSTKSWADAAAMDTPRQAFSLVTYGTGGKALLVDGTTSSWSYDDAGNAWTSAGTVPNAHIQGYAVRGLTDGRVMITGGASNPPPGVGSTNSNAVSIFSASSGWSSGPSMPVARFGHAMTQAGTKVIIAGGNYWCPIMSGFTVCSTKAAAVFDTASPGWTTISDVAQQPYAAYGLMNGRAYFFEASKVWQLLAPGATSWTTAGVDAPAQQPSVQLSPSEVLFLGSNGASNQVFRLSNDGQTCVFGFECTSGFCTGGACCETATCPSGSVCNAPLHPGTCGKLIGQSCSAATDCDSGFCVDGVCCNAACGGQCQACDVLGKKGTCTAVYGPTHGTRPACGGAGSTDPCQVQSCNGTDVTACHYAGAGVPCGSDSCTSGVETHVGACDGTGKCSDVPASCGSYSCGATACKTSCGSPPDCLAGYYCDTTKGACLPLTGLGNKCDATLPCSAGLYCTDGVCCGKISCGTGASCGIAGHEGTCIKVNGSACAKDLECGSNHCVDGVCCDAACGGQCEACDVKDSVGTCTAVTGAPHGASRPACSTSSSDVCKSGVCDGTKRDACAGFVGAAVECRAASCAGGAATAHATCDGMGNCPAPITTSCDGLKCDPTGTACLPGCTKDAECVDGFVCRGGKCTKKTATCSEDGGAVIGLDGGRTECSPFRCKAGACIQQCATSDDCASGFACDPGSGQCVAPQTDSGGGCATSSRSSSSLLSAFALALALSAAFARRRTP